MAVHVARTLAWGVIDNSWGLVISNRKMLLSKGPLNSTLYYWLVRLTQDFGFWKWSWVGESEKEKSGYLVVLDLIKFLQRRACEFVNQQAYSSETNELEKIAQNKKNYFVESGHITLHGVMIIDSHYFRLQWRYFQLPWAYRDRAVSLRIFL